MLRSIGQAAIRGKRVILRADFDVAMRKGRIIDDFRIREHLPTFSFILRHGGALRIVAHLGRPGGRRVGALSLRSVARHLERLLGRPLKFVIDPYNSEAARLYRFSPKIILFENIRFWPQEETNDSAFAGRLARWGDVYVNEAFANSHRSHASMVAITRFLPSFAGFHLQKEMERLALAFRHPRLPIVVILGGAKLETKLSMIERFLSLGADVLLGGAVANIILGLRGFGVGRSAIDHGQRAKIRRAIVWHPRLHLPLDVRVGRNVPGPSRITAVSGVRPQETIFDLGPKTLIAYGRFIRRGGTIIWNGPLGLIEVPKFSQGTLALARAIQRSRSFSVVGGGDTVALLDLCRLRRGFSHVSTGGGAMLSYLSGEKLPALEALKRVKS